MTGNDLRMTVRPWSTPKYKGLKNGRVLVTNFCYPFDIFLNSDLNNFKINCIIIINDYRFSLYSSLPISAAIQRINSCRSDLLPSNYRHAHQTYECHRIHSPILSCHHPESSYINTFELFKKPDTIYARI